MKVSIVFSHGTRVEGKFQKTCHGCTIGFLARSRNQRFCGVDCPGQKQRFVNASRRQKLRAYGLTEEKYDLILKSQNGVCAICKQIELRSRKDGKPIRLAIDHNHVTGEVRGLLCTDCNRGLGMFHDRPECLRSAAVYLEKQCD